MIHGGIDVALFSSLPNRQDARNAVFASDDKPVILLAGRFAPEKGFDVVIQSMEIVWQKVPEAELWLAGEGPENSRLVMLQAKASRPGQIRFFGYWSEIGQMYAAADVFVAPSRREGQGLSILEAMHCGLPVIATKVGGLVEMVQDGQTGLLVPVQDSEAIGHAIVRLLTDQELVQQITSRAREAVKRFDMNQVAGEIAARYDKWLSQGG